VVQKKSGGRGGGERGKRGCKSNKKIKSNALLKIV
jgi:hypothetical protein